ncbi:hypothetical protein [Hymenobacter sp. UYCo722]|uniref:hypothetical protein n=1 Tax=Hymenobacter sp. UYCo722 TaxID=3156335 RepID=UPI0033956F6A
MRYFTLVVLAGHLLFSWQQAAPKTTSETAGKTIKPADDKAQIQQLIRQVVNWGESAKSINLLPLLTTNKSDYCIGMNLKMHKLNLEKLKAANFFAAEFIENYNQIILTLDQKIRRKEIEKWHANGELPPLNFASNVDPWTLCQDVPYDKPNPYDFIKTNVITLDNHQGMAYWKWGKLDANTDASWKAFTYRFRVVKENGKWKVAYLQGFDFKNSTSKAGL